MARRNVTQAHLCDAGAGKDLIPGDEFGQGEEGLPHHRPPEERQRLARAMLGHEQLVDEGERLEVERAVEGRPAQILREQIGEEGVSACEQRLRRGQRGFDRRAAGEAPQRQTAAEIDGEDERRRAVARVRLERAVYERGGMGMGAAAGTVDQGSVETAGWRSHAGIPRALESALDHAEREAKLRGEEKHGEEKR